VQKKRSELQHKAHGWPFCRRQILTAFYKRRPTAEIAFAPEAGLGRNRRCCPQSEGVGDPNANTGEENRDGGGRKRPAMNG